MSDGTGEPRERAGLGDPPESVPPVELERDGVLPPRVDGEPGVAGPGDFAADRFLTRGGNGVVVPEEYAMAPISVRRPGWWRPGRSEIRWAVVVLVVLAVLGFAAGALWISAAPRLPFRVVKVGQAVRLGSEGEVFIADDVWYFFITLGIGLVAGALAWLPRSSRGWLMPLALAAGGIAGALVARLTGEWLTPSLVHGGLQHVGATVLFEVRLKAQAAVVTEAFAAVVTYLVLSGFADRDDLGFSGPSDYVAMRPGGEAATPA